MDEREVLRGRIRDLWHRTQEGEYLNHTGFLPLDLQSYAHRLIREDKIPELLSGRLNGALFIRLFQAA